MYFQRIFTVSHLNEVGFESYSITWRKKISKLTNSPKSRYLLLQCKSLIRLLSCWHENSTFSSQRRIFQSDRVKFQIRKFSKDLQIYPTLSPLPFLSRERRPDHRARRRRRLSQRPLSITSFIPQYINSCWGDLFARPYIPRALSFARVFFSPLLSRSSAVALVNAAYKSRTFE